MKLEWRHALSVSAQSLAEAPTFLSLASRTDVISFAGGVPDPNAFPYGAISTAIERIWTEPDLRARSFQYAPSSGYEPLRRYIAQKLDAEGIASDIGRILITSGAQQALDLIGRLLIDPGDPIAITAPTFFAAIDTFSVYRPKIAQIPFTADGLDLDLAKSVLADRPKFLYLIPEFQNPTGLCISESDRRAILQLCVEFDVPIVEDGAYRELRFSGSPLPSFAQLAGEAGFGNHVIQVNTFSKTIAPGFRVGWLSAAPAFIAKLAALKLACDVHTSVFNQMIVADIAGTILPTHVSDICTLYRTKRDAMLDALETHMPNECLWTHPDGGLFIWVTFPKQIDATALLEASMASAKVAFVPGNLFYADRTMNHECRLSFATAAPDVISEGIKRLGQLVHASMTRHSFNIGAEGQIS
ncbi:PLP-dependent aminotransferase family protein [Allorhizobium ampelinum]|uniref:aminotransferase-like domain-containing protein n=1 Tax=Allorhizobium ampelinum TaxID=3025782 RepID=UPI001F2DA01B|nr:PLP-dependent aminotransferase family protein [Allorhizobium ampelinum]